MLKILPIATIIVSLFVSANGWSTAQSQATLSEEVSLRAGLQTGLMCKADIPVTVKTKHKKAVYLIGQIRHTQAPSKPDQPGIVQIVWTGVQAKDKKRKVGYFKQPPISTFKAPSLVLTKGTQIDLIGDMKQIERTVEDLESDKILGDAQGLDQNPQSSDRRVEDAKSQRGSRSSYGQSHSGRGNGDEESQVPQNFQGQQNGSLKGDPSANRAGNCSGVASSNAQNSMGRGGSAYGRHGGGNQASSYGAGLPAGALSFAANAGAASSGSKSYPMGTSSGTAIPPKAGPTDPSSLSTGQTSDHQNRDPFAVNQETSPKPESLESEELTTEITDRGCQPRIDFDKGQYIIQTKSIISQGGKIIEESACGDSHVWYPIKKDYSGCSDKIDKTARVAYTTFQRYWLDKEGVKNYLDTGCIKDETRPHPFMDDPKNCSHHTDIAGAKAWRQAETVYFDRSNARRLVKSCHQVGDPLAITLTSSKCKPKHIFEQKHSIIQKRAVFTDQGVAREVLPCHETTQTVAHEFVKAGCKAVVAARSIIPMVKRQITVGGKKQIISADCEPLGNVPLSKTTQGCEGQLDHDFTAGRSYPKVRWFYEFNGKTKFVTSCVRSDQVYAHIVRFKDYKHEDDKLRSVPLVEVSIQTGAGPILLRDQLETDESQFIAYTLHKKGVKHQPYPRLQTWDVDRMEAITCITGWCQMVILRYIFIWQRPDGTYYEQVGDTVQDRTIQLNYYNKLSGNITYALQETITSEPKDIMELP